MTYYGCALVRQFESIGVFSLNCAEAIKNSRDKIYALQLLLQNGLNIPVSAFADSPVETDELIDIVDGAPLVVKLLQGSQGRGVVLAESQQVGQSVIHAFKSLQANLMVQEFIREADGGDLRLLVMDNKVVSAMQREAARGDFRVNLRRGGSASVAKTTAEERRLALSAARVLGLQVAGVDLIRSRKGPLILKVTSSPGLESLEELTGKDLAGHMISAVEKQLRWKRRLAGPLES